MTIAQTARDGAKPRPNRRFGAVVAGISLLALAGCFTGDLTTKDFSAFQTYQFQQTPGLGFCGDTKHVFSADIKVEAGGTMAFAHSVLVLSGPDPEQCEDGVAAEKGCFRPQDQPARTLTPQESDQVRAVFAKVTYNRQPDRICRDLAIDPCLIERHTWDAKKLSDYICAADRIGDEQRKDIRQLLADLQAGE